MKIQTNDINSSDAIEVSIIIVNYKSWDHLEPCLKSIKHIDNNILSYEVIVVDNNSNDGKYDLFCKAFPKVIFINNSGNNGFSNGCNVGAQKAKGNYYLFLNPDTLVTKTAILAMLEIAKENPDYGIISCEKQTKNGNFETSTRLFPKVLTFFGYTRAIHKLIYKNKLIKRFDKSLDIIFPDWVSGSVVFISKLWFNNVGGWNEDYWMYLEDIDLCKKINNNGGKIALTRKAKIIHNHGGASRTNIKTSALTKVELIVSKHVYINNHFKGIYRFIAQSFLLISTLISKLLWAIIGLIFFFIPKLSINLLIFINLLKYYFSAIKRLSWISTKSMTYNRKNVKFRLEN